jgi:alpha-galactosidase
MPIKIALIGAGSGAFSLSLIRDLCLTPNLAGSTVAFMDINLQRLDAAHGLCQRYAGELGASLRLEKMLDRREALRDADFVVTTALAAGHERLRQGWEIALRRGYSWGSSFHVMYDEAFWINFYQLRLFDSLIRDALELCPEAYHLLVANPVLAGVTHLGRKYPQARVVGLCHGSSGVYHLAEALGMDRERVTFEIPGVNHFVWLTHLYHRGEDAFPLLDRWIEEEERGLHGDRARPGLSRKAVDLYKRFGAYPIGDTASWSGASWPLWYHSDEATERCWGEEPVAGWNRYFEGVAHGAVEIQRVAADSSIRVTERFPARASGEAMVPIIESLACDIPRVFALAQRLALPAAHDAHYLALAERLGAEFWTADQRLVRAVQPQLSWVHGLPV